MKHTPSFSEWQAQQARKQKIKEWIFLVCVIVFAAILIFNPFGMLP